MEALVLRLAPDIIHHRNPSIELVRLLLLFYSLRTLYKPVDGFAPFSSLATRETFLDISDNVAMAPGPGYYDVKPSKGRRTLAGTGTMNSRVYN